MYPRALLTCVGVVILCNGLPVLVGTGSSAVAASAAVEAAQSGNSGERWSLWVDGYFADVATAIAGSWLGVWVVLAAAVANIGLFEAEMTSDAFQLMGMVRCDQICANLLPRLSSFSVMVGMVKAVAAGMYESPCSPLSLSYVGCLLYTPGAVVGNVLTFDFHPGRKCKDLWCSNRSSKRVLTFPCRVGP